MSLIKTELSKLAFCYYYFTNKHMLFNAIYSTPSQYLKYTY